MRTMELADRQGFPLLTLVDTPGAYPGVAAEQHGQGGMIARSQALMARLSVPIVACVMVSLGAVLPGPPSTCRGMMLNSATPAPAAAAVRKKPRRDEPLDCRMEPLPFRS